MSDETETEWDVKTTPQWARAPLALLYGVLIVYLVTCFHYSLRDDMPRWVTFGLWQMFTLRDRGSADVEAEAYYDGEWREIDLPSLFPARWESGHRYSRSSFRRSKRRMSVLAASACERLGDDPDGIRITEVRWRKVLGTLERRDERRRVLIQWRCGTELRLPNGRRLGGDS